MLDLTTVLLVALAPSFAPAPATGSVTGDDDLISPDLEDLADHWAAKATELGVPGAALTVVMDDEVVHRQTFGWRDPEREQPVTADTMFYIASATKPYVAMGLLMLAEEGKVDLDAPVRRYLPRFVLADEQATEATTVRDLLCHRAGLNSGPIVHLDAYTGEITEDRFYHFLADVEPAGRLTYSNLHFTLAGRVIEAVSGKPWRDFLDERLFTPAGMDHTTGYATWMYAQPDVAQPSQWTEAGFRPAGVRKVDATMHAAGGLGTSIRDLGQWLRLNLGDGSLDGTRFLSHDTLRAMHTQQAAGNANGSLRAMKGYGLGWQSGTYRGAQYLQHGGGYVGTASFVCFLPELGIGMAVVANASSEGQAFCQATSIDVLDRLLAADGDFDPWPGFESRVLRAHAEPEAQDDRAHNPTRTEDGLSLEPAAYVGAYSDPWWGTVHVALEDGDLRIRLGNLRGTLHGTETDAFEAVVSGYGTTGGFFVVEDGQVTGIELDLDDDGVRYARGGAR